MSFADYFKMSEISQSSETTFQASSFLKEEYSYVKAGVYNGGLLTICDSQNFDEVTLNDWEWLVGKNSLIIGYLAWGDFICASLEHESFYLVLVQEKHLVSLGNLLKGVFDVNLIDSGFRRELMWEDKFDTLKEKLGELSYGECFVPEPWPMLGGKERLEDYKKGNFATYVSLVGQEWAKRKV
ncbi:T6SS immunity protein Tdi1 domain-containing protein [Marinobacter sp. 1Y8]